jgi:CheY-like chemotaxis protein
VSKIKDERDIAESARSKFRHDLRTLFNVLLGYSEICLEEIADESQDCVDLLSRFIVGVRSALRDSEYAIERARLDSEQLFKVEITFWLKNDLLAALQKLGHLRSDMNEFGIDNEVWKDLDMALMRLTLECLNPFSGSGFSERAVQGKSTDLVTTEILAGESKGKILLVDDEWDNLVVLRHKLEGLGCSVTGNTSPKTALRYAVENSYDLVLVDLQMPEMSGLEFIDGMHAHPATKDIPVLVITASDDKEILTECINKGAVDFLPKPVDSSILKARVLSCLERKKSQDREKQMANELLLEKARVDELLQMILPAETVVELKATGSVAPKRFSNVTVLFCDVVQFTPYCESHSPEEIIAHLHSLFSEFDAIIELNGMQKIKTIGDSFMAAGNLLRPLSNPMLTAINAGLEIIDATAAHPSGWKVRVGVHMGDVVAGIVGTRQYLYDLWGDTVNTAARVEGCAKPMSVAVIAGNAPVKRSGIRTESLGLVDLRGKGEFEIVSVTRSRQRAS